MASPSTVITLGYGSFGSVNLLPTLGYGIGAEAVLTQPNVCVKVEIHKHRAKTEGKRHAKVESHKHRAKADE